MVKLTGPISEVEQKLHEELKPLTLLDNPTLKKLGRHSHPADSRGSRY
ncbi:hypothetical protein L1N85_19640 [Paenibacillus alkaliterrae]|nr:hypothetical protein [Paenibacillus alkaliterrae]MCF2940610.1 hypothetical protein [Paenibacillus alkaliterrae]